jgi:hypothetical protein
LFEALGFDGGEELGRKAELGEGMLFHVYLTNRQVGFQNTGNLSQ